MKKKLLDQGIEYKGPYDVGSGDDAPNTTDKPIVGRLTATRIIRLESLGFVWSLRDDWHQHYEELKKYKEEHNHCNVPARYNKNRKLGIWVSAQRQQYKILNTQSESSKARRSAPLTQERIDLLNKLGFTWSIRSRDSLGQSWNERYSELVQFRNEWGHVSKQTHHDYLMILLISPLG